MAIRRWSVPPDLQIQTHEHGPIAIVSRQSLEAAVFDALSMVDRAGGTFSVVVGRHPTDLPGEMVTTGAIVEWKDRTDAKEAPERAVELVAAPEVIDPEIVHDDEMPEPAVTVNEQIQEDQRELAAVAAQAIGDGLDNPPDDEDLSSIPPEQR